MAVWWNCDGLAIASGGRTVVSGRWQWLKNDDALRFLLWWAPLLVCGSERWSSFLSFNKSHLTDVGSWFACV